MVDSYWTGYASGKDFGEVAAYIERQLKGVPPERIVSITHATAALEFDVWYTAMVVLKKDSSGFATQAKGPSRHRGEIPPPVPVPGTDRAD